MVRSFLGLLVVAAVSSALGAAGEDDLPPSGLASLEARIASLFRDAVRPADPKKVTAVTGDFNGDGSEDIAVLVVAKPARLEELNSVYANWALEDPLKVRLPEMTHATLASLPAPPRREPVKAGEALIAIIHGTGGLGWRSKRVTQGYLLQHCAGAGLHVRSSQSVTAENAHQRRLPPLRGDVIEETIAGQTGFLYLLGGEYLWFH